MKRSHAGFLATGALGLIAAIAVPVTIAMARGTTPASTMATTKQVAPAAPLLTPAANVGIMVESCGYSHTTNADPILMPGMAGMSMLHDFFGNTATSAASTPSSLIGGTTTCNTPHDSSAYWMPALYVNGQKITPLHSLIYWVAPRTSNVVTPPAGLELIAGNEHATSPQPLSVVAWNCQIGGLPVGRRATQPVPCPTGMEKVTITFPNCWDGRTLAGAAQNNATYAIGATCPAGFPVMIPQIVFHALYRLPAGIVTLSSGPGTVASVNTEHADFMSGWNQDALTSIVNSCINSHLHCNPSGTITPRANPGGGPAARPTPSMSALTT